MKTRSILETDYYMFSIHYLNQLKQHYIDKGNDEELKKVKAALSFRKLHNLT